MAEKWERGWRGMQGQTMKDRKSQSQEQDCLKWYSSGRAGVWESMSASPLEPHLLCLPRE